MILSVMQSSRPKAWSQGGLRTKKVLVLVLKQKFLLLFLVLVLRKKYCLEKSPLNIAGFYTTWCDFEKL